MELRELLSKECLNVRRTRPDIALEWLGMNNGAVRPTWAGCDLAICCVVCFRYRQRGEYYRSLSPDANISELSAGANAPAKSKEAKARVGLYHFALSLDEALRFEGVRGVVH